MFASLGPAHQFLGSHHPGEPNRPNGNPKRTASERPFGTRENTRISESDRRDEDRGKRSRYSEKSEQNKKRRLGQSEGIFSKSNHIRQLQSPPDMDYPSLPLDQTETPCLQVRIFNGATAQSHRSTDAASSNCLTPTTSAYIEACSSSSDRGLQTNTQETSYMSPLSEHTLQDKQSSTEHLTPAEGVFSGQTHESMVKQRLHYSLQWR